MKTFKEFCHLLIAISLQVKRWPLFRHPYILNIIGGGPQDHIQKVDADLIGDSAEC